MKRLLAVFLLTFSLCVGVTVALPSVAAAETDVFSQACNDQGDAAKKASAGSAACSVSGANPVTGANGILAKVSRLIAYIAGISAIIIMIVGGIMYVTSQGDASQVAAARNTVIYATIGLVIVVVAQSIIVFILNKVK